MFQLFLTKLYSPSNKANKIKFRSRASSIDEESNEDSKDESTDKANGSAESSDNSSDGKFNNFEYNQINIHINFLLFLKLEYLNVV